MSAIGKEQAECTAGELVFDQVVFAEKLVRERERGREGGGRYQFYIQTVVCVCVDILLLSQVTLMGGRRGGSGDTSRHLDWTKLGNKAVQCFKTVPPLTFL